LFHERPNLSDSILRRCAESQRIARRQFVLFDGTTADELKKQAHKLFADVRQSRLLGTSKIARIHAEKHIQ